MSTHKVVGIYSGDTYRTGSLDECESFVAYEPAGSFKILPIDEDGIDFSSSSMCLNQAN